MRTGIGNRTIFLMRRWTGLPSVREIQLSAISAETPCHQRGKSSLELATYGNLEQIAQFSRDFRSAMAQGARLLGFSFTPERG
jgi:hypothetical protein